MTPKSAFKKAIDLDTASKKPRPEIQGLANSGLGEIYARNGKVPEAAAAYDAAVKADPTKASFYYKNEAVIYSQVGNTDAQAAAADKAIAANPNDALPYYLKGQALITKATVDPKTQRIVLPEGCGEAYQKYLDLDPNGPYSADVKGILTQPARRSTPATRPPRSSFLSIPLRQKGALIIGRALPITASSRRCHR